MSFRNWFKYTAVFTLFVLAFTWCCVDMLRVRHTEASVLGLPEPAKMLCSSEDYSLPLLKGIKLDPENPLNIAFIVDSADSSRVKEKHISQIVKYFLAGLTIPKDDLWVNLSPYEQDRIIPEALGHTDMGKDMLSQDYILKQLSASLTHPDTEIGTQYWQKINENLANSFSKVWIVPGNISVREYGTSAVITEAKLAVQTDVDRLAIKHDKNYSAKPQTEAMDVLLPELTKEVNQGRNFAVVRQMYNSLILSLWFKKKFAQSFYQVYLDKRKIEGIDIDDKKISEKIFNVYVKAFKKGVYDFIRKENDRSTGTDVNKRYFSGGLALGEANPEYSVANSAIGLDRALRENTKGQVHKYDIQLIDTKQSENQEELSISIKLPKENDYSDYLDEFYVKLMKGSDIKQWVEGFKTVGHFGLDKFVTSCRMHGIDLRRIEIAPDIDVDSSAFWYENGVLHLSIDQAFDMQVFQNGEAAMHVKFNIQEAMRRSIVYPLLLKGVELDKSIEDKGIDYQMELLGLIPDYLYYRSTVLSSFGEKANIFAAESLSQSIKDFYSERRNDKVFDNKEQIIIDAEITIKKMNLWQDRMELSLEDVVKAFDNTDLINNSYVVKLMEVLKGGNAVFLNTDRTILKEYHTAKDFIAGFLINVNGYSNAKFPEISSISHKLADYLLKNTSVVNGINEYGKTFFVHKNKGEFSSLFNEVMEPYLSDWDSLMKRSADLGKSKKKLLESLSDISSKPETVLLSKDSTINLITKLKDKEVLPPKRSFLKRVKAFLVVHWYLYKPLAAYLGAAAFIIGLAFWGSMKMRNSTEIVTNDQSRKAQVVDRRLTPKARHYSSTTKSLPRSDSEWMSTIKRVRGDGTGTSQSMPSMGAAKESIIAKVDGDIRGPLVDDIRFDAKPTGGFTISDSVEFVPVGDSISQGSYKYQILSQGNKVFKPLMSLTSQIDERTVKITPLDDQNQKIAGKTVSAKVRQGRFIEFDHVGPVAIEFSKTNYQGIDFKYNPTELAQVEIDDFPKILGKQLLKSVRDQLSYLGKATTFDETMNKQSLSVSQQVQMLGDLDLVTDEMKIQAIVDVMYENFIYNGSYATVSKKGRSWGGTMAEILEKGTDVILDDTTLIKSSKQIRVTCDMGNGQLAFMARLMGMEAALIGYPGQVIKGKFLINQGEAHGQALVKINNKWRLVDATTFIKKEAGTVKNSGGMSYAGKAEDLESDMLYSVAPSKKKKQKKDIFLEREREFFVLHADGPARDYEFEFLALNSFTYSLLEGEYLSLVSFYFFGEKYESANLIAKDNNLPLVSEENFSTYKINPQKLEIKGGVVVEHTVQPGETIDKLVLNYYGTLGQRGGESYRDRIMGFNKMEKDGIRAGQIILIPTNSVEMSNMRQRYNGKINEVDNKTSESQIENKGGIDFADLKVNASASSLLGAPFDLKDFSGFDFKINSQQVYAKGSSIFE